MSKNLAILVGVTDYLEEKYRLPACENDVSIMRELLLESGKFGEVIVVTSQDAQALKAELAAVVGRFQHEDIGDLFFYFTGHGEFVDEEFRFMLRDYSSDKPAQTSLEHSELDLLLRSLSPVLVVKVIDACYSGVPYIKDRSSVVDQMMAQTQRTFSKCYFLFSSQSDQRSWSGSKISDFTGAFAATIAKANQEAIRYKDVVDGLSDSFRNTQRQKPFFVIQADYTEAFGNFSEPTRSRLKERLASFEDTQDEQVIEPIVKASLADLARIQAVDYVPMSVAIDAVKEIKSGLEGVHLNSELGTIFGLQKEYFATYESLPARAALGHWLLKNDQGFFAAPTYEIETYEADSPLSSLLTWTGGDTKKVTKTRKVVSGVQTKVSKLQFQAARADLQLLLPNLTQYSGWLTFMLSKRTMQVFFCFAECKEVAWDKFVAVNPTDWKSHSYSLARFGGGAHIVECFMTEFQHYVESCVQARLESHSESDAPATTG